MRQQLPPCVVRAVAALAFLAIFGVSPARCEPTYPLRKSASGRYLVDANGAPYLMIGDSPQSLVVNLTESEAESYFANRRARGFNTVWINLLCATYTGGQADGSLLDGTRPFTATLPDSPIYDLATPNEAYFARVDRIVAMAGRYGLQVVLDPAETGGWLTTLIANGEGRCRDYGRYLGARYRAFDNVLWMSGNDFQGWREPGNDAVVAAVALGILDSDPRHLQTVQLDYLVSSSLDDPAWEPIIGVNATYSYAPTYARLLRDYGRPNFLPNFLVEANYEFESAQGPVTTAPILRKQEYWTMTSGATGQLYGNRYVWPFLDGWQDHLDSPGALQIRHLRALFAPRAWFDLVPDVDHRVVTAGYGRFSESGYVADNDYLTAARTPDGSLVIAYVPVVRSFTVNLSMLSAPITARWFDPSAGSYVEVPGSPLPNSGTRDFVPPGSNQDGDGDWVLVLETMPPTDDPPRDHLVSAYGFDEGSGTVVVDASGHGHDGAVVNATWTENGRHGGALDFNGVNAWVAIADAPELRLTTAMTLEAWVRPNAVTPAWRDVIYKADDNYYLEATSTSGGAPGAGGTFGEVRGAVALEPDVWSHLAVAYDGVTLVLYVDGEVTSSVSRTGPIATSTNPLQIGGDIVYGQFFDGSIDDVRVYDVALTQPQIRLDMATPVGSPPPPDTEPPTAPVLTATARGVSRIDLAWTAATDNVGVAGYRVERCAGSECEDFADLAVTVNSSYEDAGLTPGTSYRYRVRASDTSGWLGAYSNVADATTSQATRGLVAAYAFDEGTGTMAADASGQGHDGVIMNATWTASGRHGGALDFNGENAWVMIDDAPSLQLTTAMTLEAWVRPSVVDALWRDVIYKADDNYYLEATSTSGGVPGGGGTFGEVRGSVALEPAVWSHLALTYDGAVLVLYVNGEAVSSLPRSGPIATSTNPLQIGGDIVYGQFFEGSIDDARVYDVALLPEQIRADMASPVGAGR